jgi:hypothetical protein
MPLARARVHRKLSLGWLCHRCETQASIPPDAIRRPRDTPIWKLEAALKCRYATRAAPRRPCT